MSSQTAQSPAQRWLGLALIATAQFIVIMDTSIVGVALPDMQRDLGFTPESLSWVFNAYVVAFGGLLLLGGRLSDAFGARKIFTLGWIILIAGSAVAGAAGSVGAEIAGRAIQGAGSALIAPAALTLLMMLFGGTSDLPKAFAIYGAAAPIGGAAGVFIGGVLTEYTSWPWVFYATIPVALIVLAFTATALPRTTRGAKGSIDVAGAVTATAGLAALVYGVVTAPEVGWLTATTIGALGVGAALLIAFFVIQSRSKNPLLRLGLLRAPLLGAANGAQLVLGGAWVSMWFFLNLYLQQVLGASAFAAGAALLPMTGLVVIVMITLAPRLQARFGAKPLIIVGLLILAAGLLWMSFARADGSYAVDVLPASLLSALGMSLTFVPSLGTAINAAPPAETGVASGLVSTSYQIGSALTLAILTAVAYGVAGVEPSKLELTAGYSAAFVGAAILAAAGAAVTAVAMKPSGVTTAQ
ncbi:MFS transporter [Leucobacter albus]|uniref:MFS transporter n=1 Tax=Leucobacter albus TaxID=272210 RepID=A0ABW3TM09_9MICO